MHMEYEAKVKHRQGKLRPEQSKLVTEKDDQRRLYSSHIVVGQE